MSDGMIYRARVDWIAGGLTLVALTRGNTDPSAITARDRDGHTWRIFLESPRDIAVWLRGANETGEPWEHDPRECVACDNHQPFTVPLAPEGL